ncbi:unnamed protein product [Closterium sp. NIES-64]|nr:unnamed protein product [Closterium sp. NIES-64]
MLAASNAGVGSSASSASGGGLTAEEDVTVLEARAWVERCLGRQLPADRSLPDILEDGQTLAQPGDGWLWGRQGEAERGEGRLEGKSGSRAGSKEGEDWEVGDEGEGEAEQGEGGSAVRGSGAEHGVLARVCEGGNVPQGDYNGGREGEGVVWVGGGKGWEGWEDGESYGGKRGENGGGRESGFDLSQHRTGCNDVNVFTPPDLVERRDLRRVYLCLRTLSKRTIGISSSRSFATPTSAASFLTLATASATSAAAASSAATVTSATAATAGQPAADRSIPRWWAPAYPRPASPSRRFSHSSSVAAWQASSAAAAAAAAGTGAAGAGAAGAATGGAGAGVSREGGGPAEAVRGRRRSASVTAVQRAPLATVTPRQPTPPRTHTSPLRSISPPTSFHPSEPESLPDTSSMGRGGGGRMGQQEELGLLEQQQEGQQGRGLGARKWQLLAAAGAAVLVGGAVCDGCAATSTAEIDRSEQRSFSDLEREAVEVEEAF